MKLYARPTGPFEVNTYLLETSDGLYVIDPGAGAPLVQLLEARRQPLAGILLTHGHVDHLAGLGELLRIREVPVWLSPEDATWAFEPFNTLPPWYPEPPLRPVDLRPFTPPLTRIGDQEWLVLPTPGHTPGSVCLVLDAQRLVFTGDTLFHEGVGRTDLPGGNPDALRHSLRRLLELPGDYRVLPGHGPESTIAHERRWNPFVGNL